MRAVDDLVVLWELIELEPNGTTIRHYVGPCKSVIKFINRLRVINEYTLTEAVFYMRPFGLSIPDFDFTKHEC